MNVVTRPHHFAPTLVDAFGRASLNDDFLWKRSLGLLISGRVEEVRDDAMDLSLGSTPHICHEP